MKKLTIKSWALGDRPREKLISKGKIALSDAELIAILIGSGNREESAVALSKRILQSVEQNLNKLAKLSVEELQKFKADQNRQEIKFENLSPFSRSLIHSVAAELLLSAESFGEGENRYILVNKDPRSVEVNFVILIYLVIFLIYPNWLFSDYNITSSVCKRFNL